MFYESSEFWGNWEEKLPVLASTRTAQNSPEEVYKRKFLATILWGWYSNVFVIGPIIYVSLVILGTVFYYYYDVWDLRTSYFYAAQTLLCIGFGANDESSDVSFAFSTIYTLVGSSLIAGTIGYIFTALRNRSEEKNRLDRFVKPEICHSHSNSWLEYAQDSLFLTVLFFFFWLLLGTWYAVEYEGFDVIKAFYFIISGLSGTGNIPPACVGGDEYSCSVTNGYFWGSYILIGLPLYDVNLGILAFLAIRKYQVNKQRKNLLRPWSKDEFDFASRICSDDLISLVSDSRVPNKRVAEENISKKIDFSQFALMELSRLGQIDNDLLIGMKELFCALDTKASGSISFEDLNQMDQSGARELTTVEC
jgi:hypothetical protein